MSVLVLVPASGVSAQALDCSADPMTLDFAGRSATSPRVRYVGAAADPTRLAPHSTDAACAPRVTAGETFTLTFTGDSRITRVNLHGSLSIDSAANVERVGPWLIGAVSERRDSDNNITQQATTITFRAGQAGSAGVARIRLAPSGSNYRQTSIPVVIVPAVAPPDTGPVVSVGALFGLTVRTEGESPGLRVHRPAGFTGPVNVRVTHSGDFLVASSANLADSLSAFASRDQAFTTVDDDVWEPDGSITMELLPGDGYQVSESAGSATVKIVDNDDYAVVSPSALTLGSGLGAGERSGAFWDWLAGGRDPLGGNSRIGRHAGPCNVGVWTGETWDAGACVAGAEATYELSLGDDPGGPVQVFANANSASIGVCAASDAKACGAMRRARNGANHSSARFRFDSNNWKTPRTVTVYRYPQAGAGTASVGHNLLGVLAPERGPIGGTVTVTLSGTSQYVEVPAPTPARKTCPGKRNGTPITVPAGQDCPQSAEQAPLTDYPDGPTPHRCTARGNIANTVKGYHDANKHRAAYAANPRWARVLAAFGWTLPDAPWNSVEPFTVAEARAQQAAWDGWRPVADELHRIYNCR